MRNAARRAAFFACAKGQKRAKQTCGAGNWKAKKRKSEKAKKRIEPA